MCQECEDNFILLDKKVFSFQSHSITESKTQDRSPSMHTDCLHSKLRHYKTTLPHPGIVYLQTLYDKVYYPCLTIS